MISAPFWCYLFDGMTHLFTLLTSLNESFANIFEILHYSSDLWPYSSCYRKDLGIVLYISDDEDLENH